MKKESFESMMIAISRRNSLGAVFTDFLEMTICAFSRGAKEERYLEIISKYKKEEIHQFPNILGQLVIEMDNNGEGLKDVLGEYFTEHITRGHNGQFFTPDSITDLMAGLSGIKDAEPGYKINDCACGSGRTLLSAAKQNRGLIFFGADVDKNCAMMTVINMFLNSMKGEVAWMNTLSQEFYGAWRILRFPNPIVIEIEKKDCYQVLEIPEKPKLLLPEIPDIVIPETTNDSFGDQLSLF